MKANATDKSLAVGINGKNMCCTLFVARVIAYNTKVVRNIEVFNNLRKSSEDCKKVVRKVTHDVKR